MTNRDDILISLKPDYADCVFAGKKTVELRRRKPNISPGTRIWIYATAPVAAIKGHARLVQIVSASPIFIWRIWGAQTGISKDEFDAYFEGYSTAHALILSDVMSMDHALPLARIRELVRGFQPPQFYYHLNGAAEKMRLDRRKYQRVG